MKKSLFSLIMLSSTALNTYASTNLMQAYQQALTSDPIYQQAISQTMATKEGVPISLANLLPTAALQLSPALHKTTNTGNTTAPLHTTTKGYELNLTLNQTIFNFAQFAELSSAKALSHQADATLNAAMQSLMLRVATAYFTVLKDQDNLAYNKANKEAFAKQLDQINQEYKVGLKTITDVYTAQASFDTASAGYIAAQTTLENDKENLRTITGESYTSMSTLSQNFPLISPKPADINAWVKTATMQNWSIKAAEFASQSALANVKQQFAGNLPSLSTQGNYTINYSRPNAGSANNPPGSSKSRDLGVALTLNVPLVSGGGVVAATNQARYNYQASTQQLEQTIRATINTTRQSYLGVLAGIQQIQADKQAVKSSMSSLEGMDEGYHVGTQTLVDVLNQQQKVFQAETNYASDRYAYVNNLLTLKQAAGTLSQQDLEAINAWLVDRDDPINSPTYALEKALNHSSSDLGSALKKYQHSNHLKQKSVSKNKQAKAITKHKSTTKKLAHNKSNKSTV
jgi:outer membrane protein